MTSNQPRTQRRTQHQFISKRTWAIVKDWKSDYTWQQVCHALKLDYRATKSPFTYLRSLGLITKTAFGTYRTLPNKEWKGMTSYAPAVHVERGIPFPLPLPDMATVTPLPPPPPPLPMGDVERPVSIQSVPDVDALLELVFPNGIPTTMFKVAFEWYQLTIALMERAHNEQS